MSESDLHIKSEFSTHPVHQFCRESMGMHVARNFAKVQLATWHNQVRFDMDGGFTVYAAENVYVCIGNLKVAKESERIFDALLNAVIG